MEQNNEKLERFISAVNSDTDKRVAEILAEGEAEKKRILNQAHSAAEQARNRHISDSGKMSAGKYVRMVSKAELDMKKEVLLCRENLTNSLFDRVKEKINDFKSGDGYTAMLIKQITAEKPVSGDVIGISADDMRFAEIIKKAAGAGVEVSSDETIILGGFYLLHKDEQGNGTIIDKTFDCALKEQRSIFASRSVMTARQ